MTLRKIKAAAIVCGMILSTGCVYQAELTEFLDDPTGMKAEKEMCTEYEPSETTEQTEYASETEYSTEAVTELTQESEPITTTTAVTITAETITTTITTISAEEETIFTSDDMEQIEPHKEAATSTTALEEPTEELTEPTEASQNCHLDDYQKAVEIYEYMIANGSGTCVQHAYQTYQMCAEYGLECYFVWTEAKLYGHVANAVCIDGVWYVLDTQGRCFLTENMCEFTELVDEDENFVASADIISPTRYE